MDCPKCGLASPPTALQCDCGYDFETGKPSETPEWATNPVWGQKVAAFWSISWPAVIGSFLVGRPLARHDSAGMPQHSFAVIVFGVNLAFFALQAVLTGRLARKNYRSFRVYVVRGDGQRSRGLSMQEAAAVWLWILGPQLALLLAGFVIFPWWGATLAPKWFARALSSRSYCDSLSSGLTRSASRCA